LGSAVARISSAWRRPLARRDRRAARSQHPAPATEPRRWRNRYRARRPERLPVEAPRTIG